MNQNKKSKIWMIIALIAIIIVVLGVVLVVNNNNKGIDEMKKTEKRAKVEDEASKLTLEEYKTDNFIIKKPTGWTVETGGTGMFYAIRVYDPQNANNQVYLMLK